MEISISNNFITFIKSGEGKNILIFSPFTPFPNKLIEDFFKKINIKNSQFIFSELDNSSIKLLKDFNFNNLIQAYSNLLESIDEHSEIHLFGFGFFSILFLKLLKDFNNKIKTCFFFEPDFLNSILMRSFDNEKSNIKDYRSLSNFFINTSKKNINISKKNLKYLKVFYYNIQKYLIENEILKDLLNNKTKISIFWKIMAMESCPLPQILEEFNLNIISIKENIYKSFYESDALILHEIEKILK
jgi:hypothetical protein